MSRVSNEILHERIAKQFTELWTTPPEVPAYVLDNLKHELRPYQRQALSQFIFTQELENANFDYNHLLFHMATGSGKTQVLAATMLYLFKEQGKQNFIFFVNSDAIIKKTYDNLTNTNSSKYLFNTNGIVIDGNRINIQLVDVFPTIPDQHTIYLKSTSIQKLHGDLTEPKENTLTYEALKELDIVLLGDEAHHYFADTKRSKKKLTAAEQAARTWEKTIDNLLRLRPGNRLLGFSATFNLTNDILYHKIKDHIVYQYDLGLFMDEGYSKNVMLLRANEDDETKMLYGILLSQYRKYVARDNGIDLKPVILFKSNTIAISLQAHEMLNNLVNQLSVRQLQQRVHAGYATYQRASSIWSKMFAYFKEMDLGEVIRDLQWDFAEGSILNANARDFLSEDNALLLNSLEEPNNPIRAIFAVAKLNEGWDVLNLFDIVRISEGATETKNTTDSEAQLIGRGARYYPFAYEDEQSFTRRFDYSVDNADLKIIEALHYHTINDNAYIKNLEKSLKAAKIQVQEDEYERIEAKIKPSFKKHPIFKSGKIYINKLIPTTVDDYDSLEKYNVFPSYEVPLQTAIEHRYDKEVKDTLDTRTHEVTWKVDQMYIQKAIQRKPFFHFNNLREYVPSISSMKTFIEEADFLGELKLHVSLPSKLNMKDISPMEKLKMVERFFDYMERGIRNNYMKEKGTPVFEGVSFSKLVNNYHVELNKVNERISNMNEYKKTRNMREHDWFIYDKAIINNWESSFIDFINDYIDELKEKYRDVYLIRNERKVKVVEIDGTRGFMPDFLLYLQDDECTYQVFLEPKGDHLRLEDQWKEDFITSLTARDDVEVLTENEDVRLLGIKFYSETPNLKDIFREDFKEKLL